MRSHVQREGVVGGHRLREGLPAGGHYYAPTVLTGATRDMALFAEETFGPVVPLFRFDNEQDVVQQANDTPYGLAAYFYSRCGADLACSGSARNRDRRYQ